MIHIGVDVSDGDFAFALARGLSRTSGQFQVHLDNVRDCDLILSDNENRRNIDKVLYLSDKGTEEDSASSIYKYSDCRKINNRVLERVRLKECAGTDYISEAMSDYEKGKKLKTKLVSFVGDSGGSGVTSAVISISRMLSEVFGKKTLYLNLQSRDNSKLYFGNLKDEAKTQKLFYYLENGIEIDKNEYVMHGTPDYIKRNEIDDFVYNADKYEIIKLMDIISKGEPYNYIFLDIGTEFSKRNMEMIETSHVLVVVQRSKNSRRTAVFDIAEKLSSSMMIIDNFSKGYISDNNRFQSVAWDDEAFKDVGGIRTINLKTVYGSDMWKFTNKLERLYGGL